MPLWLKCNWPSHSLALHTMVKCLLNICDGSAHPLRCLPWRERDHVNLLLYQVYVTSFTPNRFFSHISDLFRNLRARVKNRLSEAGVWHLQIAGLIALWFILSISGPRYFFGCGSCLGLRCNDRIHKFVDDWSVVVSCFWIWVIEDPTKVAHLAFLQLARVILSIACTSAC